MKEIVSKNKCTGCGSCFSICPKSAIKMQESTDGFKYPIINENECINCGLCKKTCPVLNTQKNISINECYVAFTIEKKYKEKSSSGGIFPLIANNILEKNGIVIGAAFDEKNKLNHIAITNKKDLNQLIGSKYLQSDLNNIFEFVKNNIKEKIILFVGTPCQIAGLKSYLKKDYDKLFCIDLVCHGVPSPKVFKKYINELENENKDKLINYNFRDKSTGWDTYSNTASFKNKKITEINNDNKYMKLFLSDIALRESCYNCNFKLGNKYSDITLGDFWGVEKYYPEMYNKDGVSAIIINTSKGKDLFSSINKELKYKKCKLDEIVSGNPSLKKSSSKPQKRKCFFNELDSKNIDNLIKKFVNNRFIIKKIFTKFKMIVKKYIKLLKNK